MEQKMKVLIADPCAGYRRLVAWRIHAAPDLELAGATESGAEALLIAWDTNPDVIVLDVRLEHLDGISVMHRLREQQSAASCIMVSSSYADNVFLKAAALGVRSILLKPFSTETLMENIRSMKNPVEDCACRTPGLEKIVTETLNETGIPPYMKGHRYLREAIIRTVGDGTVCRAMTELCYPALAKQFNTTPSSVERAMRHAIEATWEYCDRDSLWKIFGDTAPIRDKTPTNREWIATLANHVTKQMDDKD